MAPRVIRSFLQAIGLLHRGRVEEKLNSELARLIESVEQHPEEKASGSITLTLTVTKLADRIDVKPKVETKLPKDKDFPSSTFWPLEGGLSLEHPSQGDMFGPRDAAARREMA